MTQVQKALLNPFRRPILTLTMLALAALIALVWATGSFEPRPAAADDATYYLDCPTTEVREGENVAVFLVRVTNHNHTTKYWAYWYTDAGTADETDYVHQSTGKVWTTDAEAAADRDKHVFRTRSDNALEEDETFTARFGPDDDIVDLDDPDWDHKCEITILDDDPNIQKVEVTSEPARESNTYGVGEVIEISATFSNRVEVANGGNPRLGLWVGDTWRQAQYLRGSDSRVLVFGYTVKADDEDTDGIRMGGGYKDNNGSWHNFPGYEAITHLWSDRVVYRAYKGFDDDEDHKVDGSLPPLSTNVEITSTPETGDTYRFGETVEVSITFSAAMDVEGSRYINLWSGPDGDTVWRGGAYSRGSGTDTLVFAYDVRSRDLDPDGITTEGTSTFEMDLGIADEPSGLGGDGTITIAGTDTEVYPRFSGLYDAQGSHKLDGRPYPKEMSITSTPISEPDTYGRDEIIEVSVDFGQSVTADDHDYVLLGLDTDLTQKLAEYASGNGTNVLVFRYSVDERDRDDDGISVELPDSLEITATDKEDVPFDHNPPGAINSLDEDPDHKIFGFLTSGDQTPPTVRAVTISGGPASSNDTYEHGERIVVQAYFDETVRVQGQVQIDLDIGGKVRAAVHPNPFIPADPALSIGQRIRFYYQVREGDVDDDGVSIVANSLMLQEATIEDGVTIEDGGSIEDEAGNPALLAHHGVPDDPEHLVSAPDNTAPTISSVRIVGDPGDDDTYGEGDVVSMVAFFSEDVIVTGTPQLELDFDGTTKTADYVSAFGTEEADPSEVKFTYTVALNDSDTDGIAIGNNALTLNGGTIQDESENDADLTFKAIPSQSGHKVDGSDTTPPTVSSLEITSDPVDDETYGLGDAIEVTVTFSEDVAVTGTPQLELDFDGTAKTAEYSITGGSAGVFGTNTTTLATTSSYGPTAVFSYTVALDESDTDGIAISADKLSLNDGAIRDEAGNDATLTHDALAADSGHKVDGADTVAPTVLSIAVTSFPGDDNTYGTGDTIRIAVTFSEEVTVTGTPQLELEFYDQGSANKLADYSSSDGADVVFEYTVAVGDSASDGLAIEANKLTLNGGTIQDPSGNDAVLNHVGYGPDADHIVFGGGGV